VEKFLPEQFEITVPEFQRLIVVSKRYTEWVTKYTNGAFLTTLYTFIHVGNTSYISLSLFPKIICFKVLHN